MPLANIVNRMELDGALLWLLTFEDYAGGSTLRAVNNLEDVTSRGDVFSAFPFSLTLPPDDGEKPQNLSVTMTNVGLELIELIREYDVTRVPKVKMELVLSDAPDVVEMTLDFMTVDSVNYDQLSITFSLTSSSIFARKTSRGRYDQIQFPSLFWQLR